MKFLGHCNCGQHGGEWVCLQRRLSVTCDFLSRAHVDRYTPVVWRCVLTCLASCSVDQAAASSNKMTSGTHTTTTTTRRRLSSGDKSMSDVKSARDGTKSVVGDVMSAGAKSLRDSATVIHMTTH